jgi:hypothetical protein
MRMELTLLNFPANEYEPGNISIGVTKYGIESNQGKIDDIRLYFDGNLFIRPFGNKFEAYRFTVTLVEEMRQFSTGLSQFDGSR